MKKAEEGLDTLNILVKLANTVPITKNTLNHIMITYDNIIKTLMEKLVWSKTYLKNTQDTSLNIFKLLD